MSALHSTPLADVVRVPQVTLGYSPQDLETEALLLCNPVCSAFSLWQNHPEGCETDWLLDSILGVFDSAGLG